VPLVALPSTIHTLLKSLPYHCIIRHVPSNLIILQVKKYTSFRSAMIVRLFLCLMPTHSTAKLSAQTCGWWTCLEARPAREAASLQSTIEPLHPEPARSCPPRIRAVAGQPPGTSSDHNSRYPARDTVQYCTYSYSSSTHSYSTYRYTGIYYRQLVHIYIDIVKTAGPHVVTQLVHNNPDLTKMMPIRIQIIPAIQANF
jgi:hypothetical protein